MHWVCPASSNGVGVGTGIGTHKRLEFWPPSLQVSLFPEVDEEREKKEQRRMEAADQLNLWYGGGTLTTATAGQRQQWQRRHPQSSPCYTTRG